MVLFLRLCLAIFLCSAPCFAELYKCGDLWSTTPCAAGSKPVDDLPSVRGAEKQKQGVIKAYAPTASVEELCSDSGEGALFIERVVVNIEGGNYIVDLSVRNKARTNYSGKLYVYIRDPKRGIAMVKAIGRYIPFNSSDLFSVPLSDFAPQWYYGPKLQVQLLYEEGQCLSKEVIIPVTSGRQRRRFKLSDPLTNGEGSVILAGLKDEQDEAYTALPQKGGKIDMFTLKALFLKTEQLLVRAGVFCKRIKDNGLLYQCGVIDQRLRESLEHIKQVMEEQE